MQHFPVFLDLRGQTALLLGSGEQAEAKATLLAAAGAAIRRADSFTPALLDGIVLAIGAGTAEAELVALAAACRARGIPVNVVDRPALCSALLPAIIDRAPMTIAVSSGGAAPVLARLVRQKIEAVLPPGLGLIAALAERWKAAIRQRLPALGPRRRFLEQVLEGEPSRRAAAGDAAGADRAMTAALASAEERPRGMVHLVGAGPGAGDLLTLRALRLLGEADVIVHDRLGCEDALGMARRDAERIFVGKRRGDHCLPQDGINALLVRLARDGKRVVRLKGGDPLIFGRGGEEAEALAAAGIPCEVVPGVTAALACAAGAGIPLTHRDAARAVTFVTGHRREGGVDLAGLVQPGVTLAIYMGIAMLRPIHDALLAGGMSPAMPAAVIERGGTPGQRVLRGTLAEMLAQAPGWVTEGPALLLVGEAVGRATPAWASAAERPGVSPPLPAAPRG
jgi:uroporphyrin-III C-methyltransferase/precorrin-2 dehydrogenase/sirohydrochlorin ferrochelatase